MLPFSVGSEKFAPLRYDCSLVRNNSHENLPNMRVQRSIGMKNLDLLQSHYSYNVHNQGNIDPSKLMRIVDNYLTYVTRLLL